MRNLAGRGHALVLGITAVLSSGVLFGSVTPGAGAAPTSVAGAGNSFAQTIQLDPRTAGLSYQITFGAALANHQNTVARAQAQTANMGVIGTALTAQTCDGSDPYFSSDSLPKPVKVDSREDGAAAGKTEHSGPWEQTARATEKPYAESFTRLAPFSLGGIVTMLGGISRSTSGLDDKGKPLTTADVQIAGIDFLNGAVTLEGLHWHSASRPGKVDPATQFSIEGIKIAGVDAPDEPGPDALDAVNLVLNPLGIELRMPKIHTDNGTTFVDPLRVAIIESRARDQIAGRITDAIQPLREQVFGYLIDNAPCEYNPSSLVLVADILTLSLTGGGSMGINFGGTQAAVRNIETASLQPFTFAPSVDSNVASGNVGSGSGFTSGFGSGDSGLAPVVDLDSGGSSGNGGVRRALPASTSDADDNAMWVALAVIGLGAVLVEGELRLRRRAGRAELVS